MIYLVQVMHGCGGSDEQATGRAVHGIPRGTPHDIIGERARQVSRTPQPIKSHHRTKKFELMSRKRTI